MGGRGVGGGVREDGRVWYSRLPPFATGTIRHVACPDAVGRGNRAARAHAGGHIGWVQSVAFAPDGRLLAAVSNLKTVWLWDAPTGAPLRTLDGDIDRVRRVDFAPDRRLLYSWWRPGGALRADYKADESVAFSPDGRLLAFASGDDAVQLWDVRDVQRDRKSVV